MLLFYVYTKKGLALRNRIYYYTDMKLSSIIIMTLGAGLLSSCSLFNPEEQDYTPEYLREDSPLDPPGTAETRAALRAKLVKEGAFAPGEQLEVQQGKVFLFYRNPDHSHDTSGRMVDAATARIVSCEGLYYFVETEGGKKGYLRESDLVSPVKTLISTEENLFPAGEMPVLPDNWGDDAGSAADGAQKLMTTSSGRTVVVVKKKSDKSAEFEARKKQLEEAAGQQLGGTPTEGAPLPDPASVPLPEPTGGEQN